MNWNKENKLFYYIFMSVIIFLMIVGLIAALPEYKFLNGMHYFHILIVIMLSVYLLIYPVRSTFIMRLCIILTGMVFFYLMFYLYPETRFSFILICFVPATSILFFDKKLFNFALIANLVLFFIGYFSLLYLVEDNRYDFLDFNMVGNMTNFLGSQAIIFFIYKMFIERIKEQQLYYEQLQQSERQRMTGQLAAAVAHEIRNPLTVVKGFLQLYGQDNQLGKEAQGHFKLMVDELEVAEHVISQFLMVSKPNQDLSIVEIDMEKAIKGVVDIIKSYGLLRDNTITLSIKENAMLKINIIEFHQLMINIIKNAMEASKEGEEVRIETRLEKNGQVEISIIDHGCGMDDSELNTLGLPFYSLKTKGTGLGMMICFNLVEKYKGKLKVYSEKGIGTIVRIYLPIEKVNTINEK